MRGRGLELPGSSYGQVAKTCEHGGEESLAVAAFVLTACSRGKSRIY
jgi:hypothetical protein